MQRFHDPPWIIQKVSTSFQNDVRFSTIYLCLRLSTIIQDVSKFNHRISVFCLTIGEIVLDPSENKFQSVEVL